MRILVALTIASLCAALMPACSSESDVFETCDLPGGTHGVCEDGTVCGKPSDKANTVVCLPICNDDKQCPKDYDCKGVEGSGIKGCRAKG